MLDDAAPLRLNRLAYGNRRLGPCHRVPSGEVLKFVVNAGIVRQKAWKGVIRAWNAGHGPRVWKWKWVIGTWNGRAGNEVVFYVGF
jgi:hypothetical protein